MAGATSLVELILKKWGDDIAGAAKELEEKVGFPESVANRIATGELPMDAESIARRADEQGYGEVLYHGSTNPLLLESAPMEVGKRNAVGGNGLFTTDNPRVASTYAYDSRVNGGTGPDGGTIYPLRVRDVHPSERVTVKDRGHRGEAYTTFWDEIPADNIRGIDSPYDSDQILETDSINRVSKRQGKKVVEYSKLMDSAEDAYGIGETDAPSNVTAVLDNTLLRSPNAAFDPQYTGPNIMGGAALPVAAGLLAAGQSDDADAGVTLRMAQGVDLDRLVGAWRKAVSREPDIHPSTHLEKIIHNKDFINYDDWATYARNKDGGKNGETYFNELKPFLIDISKHPNVAKDKRLRLGLTDYANKRFAIRKAEGHKPDGPRGGQRGSADPYSLLPVAGVGLAASSLTAPQIQDSGMASAPRSETLGNITMGLRDIERRVEGSPASLLFPEGLTNYLETVNRSTEDPNWLTRTMAALDFAP